VVAAGPIANLILCVAPAVAMFVIGRQDFGHRNAGHGAERRISRRPIQSIDGDRGRHLGRGPAGEMTKAAMDGRDGGHVPASGAPAIHRSSDMPGPVSDQKTWLDLGSTRCSRRL
jgi:hypothetical protein